MLIPVPLPTYTVSPLIAPLSGSHRRTVEDGLRALADEIPTAIVTGVGSGLGGEIVELAVNSGRVILLERAAA
ncbi:MAG TPA: hypothetical protein PKE32_02185 [Miltoncostaeaceae bacterium]|nr:hypothetical protein [Miltoncostaeaceae bacterium]